jgi:hypothetical protein
MSHSSLKAPTKLQKISSTFAKTVKTGFFDQLQADAARGACIYVLHFVPIAHPLL